jgi:hypothetical protein
MVAVAPPRPTTAKAARRHDDAVGDRLGIGIGIGIGIGGRPRRLAGWGNGEAP